MNVKQCPACKRYDNVVLRPTPEIRGNFTEIYVPAYCPDCGYSWYVVYQPDYTTDRE